MAIEDATTLAILITKMRSSDTFSNVARTYERMRRPRIDLMREVIRQNLKSYALSEGAEQEKRDQEFSTNSGKALATQNWRAEIEDYNAFEEVCHVPNFTCSLIRFS